MTKKFETTCLLSGCLLLEQEIVALEFLYLPTDNWYPQAEANSKHPKFRCGHGLFALVNDGRGLAWYPVSREEKS